MQERVVQENKSKRERHEISHAAGTTRNSKRKLTPSTAIATGITSCCSFESSKVLITGPGHINVPEIKIIESRAIESKVVAEQRFVPKVGHEFKRIFIILALDNVSWPFVFEGNRPHASRFFTPILDCNQLPHSFTKCLRILQCC